MTVRFGRVSCPRLNGEKRILVVCMFFFVGIGDQ
jgi:hypothetical protein